MIVYLAVQAFFAAKKVDAYNDIKSKKFGNVILEITPSSLSERSTFGKRDNSLGLVKYLFDLQNKYEYSLFRNVKFLDDMSQNKENNIKAIFINIGDKDVYSRASVSELGTAISNFKSATGVPVIAYVNRLSLTSLYLASFADKVVTSQDPEFLIRQYSIGNLYLKDFYDRYGVGVQTHRLGKYKSSPESTFENKITPAYQEGVVDFYLEIQNDIVDNIAFNRKIKDKSVILPSDDKRLANIREFGNEYILLQNNGVIDEIIPQSNVMAVVEEFAKLKSEDKSAPKFININDYIANQELAKQEAEDEKAKEEVAEDSKDESNKEEAKAAKKIAVFSYVGGVVTSGDPDSYISADQILKDFDELDPKEIGGVLLRVDSGGGSSLASKKISQAIEYVSKVKKIPVVVSQANVAASAAYSMSAAADTIFTDPLTITGSIGTYLESYNVKDVLSKNLSINVETYGGGAFNSDYTFIPLLNVYGSLGDFDINKRYIHGRIEAGYKEFVSQMAIYRKMDYDSMQEIAQGRVWLGKAAIINGLADYQGGVLDAYNHVVNLILKKHPYLSTDDIEVEEMNPVIDTILKTNNNRRLLVANLQNYVDAYVLANELEVSYQTALSMVEKVNQADNSLNLVTTPLSKKFDPSSIPISEPVELCQECIYISEAK